MVNKYFQILNHGTTTRNLNQFYASFVTYNY